METTTEIQPVETILSEILVTLTEISTTLKTAQVQNKAWGKEVIGYEKLKEILGAKPGTSQVKVRNALERAGIPYKPSIDGVFTTYDAINTAIMGGKVPVEVTERIELL